MTQPIASLHYLFSFDNRLGGAVHAALNVCKFLAESGQPTEALAPSFADDDLSQLSTLFSGFASHTVPGCGPRKLWNSREVAGWLKKNAPRFSVVELHGVWSMATLKVARTCASLGKPYLLRPHGSLDPFDLQKQALLKRILGPIFIRTMLKNSAGIVCTAALEAERLVTFGADPPRHVVPLPVPLPAQRGNRSRFRAEHGIPDDAQVVLFLSRIDYKKGLEFLIPAMARLKQDHPKLWFVMAGTGTAPFVASIRKLIDDSHMRAWTSEVGFLSGFDKQDAYAAADIFALPSLNENFGIVNVEAMYAGLPLLISDQVYIHREIDEAGAGLICKPNVESVGQALRQGLSEPDRLRSMGDNGVKLVQTRYRPEAATQELINLYRRIVRPV